MYEMGQRNVQWLQAPRTQRMHTNSTCFSYGKICTNRQPSRPSVFKSASNPEGQYHPIAGKGYSQQVGETHSKLRS